MTDLVFRYDRPLPPEWREELARVSPPSHEFSFLALLWSPGIPEAPEQRWMLYEMVPLRSYSPEWQQVLSEEFAGPDPWQLIERITHTDKIPVGRDDSGKVHYREEERIEVVQPTIIGRNQWLLHHEWKRKGYECVPCAFWVIQGDRGGHPKHYDQHQTRERARAGLPSDPPLIGALPYAPFDGRVTDAVLRHNKLLSLGGDVREFRRKYGRDKALTEAERERAHRAALVAWLDEETRESDDLMLRAFRNGELDALPRTTTDWEAREAEGTARYIETGRL